MEKLTAPEREQIVDILCCKAGDFAGIFIERMTRLSASEKKQVSAILQSKAEEVEHYLNECRFKRDRRKHQHLTSVELALSREGARLRHLSLRVNPPGIGVHA